VSIEGIAVATDDRSKGLIEGAKAYLDQNPSFTVQFKTERGWATMDHTAMALIFNGVAAHVQSCFAAEQAIAAQITAGTLTTFAAIDDAYTAAALGGS